MEFEERRLVAWEVLPRVHLLRVVRGPPAYIEIAQAGRFWRVPATDVRGLTGTPERPLSVLNLPGGVLSLNIMSS